MDSLQLDISSVTYPPHAGYALHMTAKRYADPDPDFRAEDGLTLVLLHGTSFHKESWEPTLACLFQLARERRIRIREAWAIDCPNHGMAGLLNDRILLQPEHFLNFSCEKFAQGVSHFLTAGPSHGAHIDFSTRTLVGIGHSLGGNAMAMVAASTPSLYFRSLIIVDPMLSPDGPSHLAKLRLILIKGAYERRDVWPDRTTALAALKKRERTKAWDPRILDVFVKYAVVPHPGSFYAESPYEGVTLACTRDQEAAMYRDPEGATKPVAMLEDMCRSGLPVHLVLGGINDFMPKRTQDVLRRRVDFASVTVVEKSGHLIPQEQPEALGRAFADVLQSLSQTRVVAKL